MFGSKKIATIGAVLLTSVFALGSLAACGGAASATNGSGVQEIKIATGNDGKPFCYMNENGDLDGYDVAHRSS